MLEGKEIIYGLDAMIVAGRFSFENVVNIVLMKKENLKANRYITVLYERSPYSFPPQGTIPERLYNNDLIVPSLHHSTWVPPATSP